MTSLPQRGEVWWADTREAGRRPVVILTRDEAIPRLGRTLVALCTTTVRGLASEVVLDPEHDPVPQVTAVNLDSVESVDLDDLVLPMGRLSYERMGAVCAALEVAVGCAR